MGLVWGSEGSEGMLRRGRRRSIGTGSYFATSVLFVSISAPSVHFSSLFASSHRVNLSYFYPACCLTWYLPCELVGSDLSASAVLCTLDRYVGDSGECSY